MTFDPKDYNPWDPEVQARLDEAHAALREGCPVHHSPEVGFYTAARHREVADILRTTDVWSSKYGPMPSYLPLEVARALVDVDPPEHTAQRRLFTKAFVPRTINGMEDEIAKVVGEIIDEVVDRKRADLITDVAWRIPMRVIGLMLGLTNEEAEGMRPFVAEALESLPGGPKSTMREWIPGPVAGEQSPAMKRSATEASRAFLADLIERRRQQIADGLEVPPYDLVKNMITAEDDGRRITIDEMLALLGFLLVAGTGTTALMIGNVVNRLLEHPDQMAKLRANPELCANAIEESLRYDAPVHGLFRTNEDTVEMANVTIPQDSKVHVLFGSANRDSAAWDDPDRFDIERDLDTVSRHYAFGVGIHLCLGAPLARLEGRLTLRAIVDRLPNLRRDGDPTPIGGMIVKGFTALPVAWD